MATAVKKKQVKAGGTRHRGRMPTKRTINFAGMGEKPVNVGLAIPSIILIALAAIVFSKFLVIDRLTEVSAAESAVASLQRQVDAGYAELADFDDLALLYAHYTYSGFTSEELNRSGRPAVMQLIRDNVLPYAKVGNWSVSGNNLTINLRAESLQQINLIVQQLEAQDMVDYCTVNTANAADNTRSVAASDAVRARNNDNNQNSPADDINYDAVAGRIQVYLNGTTGVNAS